VAGVCEHGNDLSGFREYEEILDQLHKKDCTPQSWLARYKTIVWVRITPYTFSESLHLFAISVQLCVWE
jgi:hypothetical protein